MNIDIRSVRLDRYYSFKSIVNYFDKYSRFFLIPKKNIYVNYSGKRFREILRTFIYFPYEYLRKYYRRNYVEGMFSSDKNLIKLEVMRIGVLSWR